MGGVRGGGGDEDVQEGGGGGRDGRGSSQSYPPGILSISDCLTVS